MNTHFKALGLALFAVFAIGAIAAQAASAQQGFLTSDGPVALTAEETPEPSSGTNKFTGFGLTTTCPGSTITGHKWNTTPHEFIPNGATTITLTPKYVNCVITPGNFPMTIDMNGCDYVAHIGETTGEGEDTYGITFDLKCNKPTESITWTIFTNATKHAENKPFCIIHFGEEFEGKPVNQGIKGAHISATTKVVPKDLDITGTMEGIHAVKTNAGEDPLLCANQTTAAMKWDLDLTVKGHNEALEPTDVWLSHN